MWPKNAKTPPLVTFSPENAKPKAKNVFFPISTRKLAKSVEGLNTSLAACKYRSAKLCKKSGACRT